MVFHKKFEGVTQGSKDTQLVRRSDKLEVEHTGVGEHLAKHQIVRLFPSV